MDNKQAKGVEMNKFLNVGISLAILVISSAAALGVTPAPAAAPVATSMVMAPTGDLISVRIMGDIGSRISNEGDTFGVVTVEDYYVQGKLVLPKGSPGYGEITHVKRAGMWHAGGELKFTVKRLVAPDGTTLAVETNGATADADKSTEKNGNEAGQYILWGPIGIFTHRGNDILIKDGAFFHVAVSDSKQMPIVVWGTKPAAFNSDLVTVHPATPQPQAP